jgi:hypothetical protein
MATGESWRAGDRPEALRLRWPAPGLAVRPAVPDRVRRLPASRPNYRHQPPAGMIYLPPADVVDAMTAAAARANGYGHGGRAAHLPRPPESRRAAQFLQVLWSGRPADRIRRRPARSDRRPARRDDALPGAGRRDCGRRGRDGRRAGVRGAARTHCAGTSESDDFATGGRYCRAVQRGQLRVAASRCGDRVFHPGVRGGGPPGARVRR